jgi:hypothetical protein
LEGAKTLKFDYDRTSRCWTYVQVLTTIIFFVTQCILLITNYPALAACIAPLTAMSFVQLFTSMRIVAMEENLVINKKDDSVTATYYPRWGAPLIK